MKQAQRVFRPGLIAAIGACYLTSALILGTRIGPWEAVREAVVGGFLALGWILLLQWILRQQPVPELPLVRWPRLELTLLLLALSGMIALAAIRYQGQYMLPSWTYHLLGYGTILAIVITGGYGCRALGLTRPPRRAWLGVAAVIGLNIFSTLIYAHLPPGEAPDLPAADLAQQLSTPFSVLLLLLGLLVRAAFPEELVLRVGIQPRLARFMPIGWAIALQAVLFNTAHFPQQFIGYQQPLVVSIGYLLTIENGLMAGYLWYRTRSLPVLLLVHLFAFPRFGS